MAIAVRIWEHGDMLCCKLTMPLRSDFGGAITIVATLDSRRVLDALRESGVQFSRQQVGSVFGSIGKVVKKIGKISVLKKALALGKALVNNPLAHLLAPGVAEAIHATSGAAKLIAASKGSDKNKAKKAKLALAAAQAQAKAENTAGKPLPLPSGIANRGPATKGAFRYLVTVNRAAA
jgi:hypothetical protein